MEAIVVMNGNFDLRKVCKELLSELQESINDRFSITFNIDVRLGNNYTGDYTPLIRSLRKRSKQLIRHKRNQNMRIALIMRRTQNRVVIVQSRVYFTDNAAGSKLYGNISQKPTNETVFEYLHRLEIAQGFSNSVRQPFLGKKILIAEDNEINAMVFSEFLQEWGADVYFASNGIEAVEQSGQNFFDGILMDIHMPLLNGNAAIGRIRKFNDEVPIIALTASDRDEDWQHALQCGANDILLKPVSSDELFHVLSQHLGIL